MSEDGTIIGSASGSTILTRSTILGVRHLPSSLQGVLFKNLHNDYKKRLGVIAENNLVHPIPIDFLNIFRYFDFPLMVRVMSRL